MNYAQKIKENYFANKERIAAERKKLHLNYVLTLQDKLEDSYKAYKEFCMVVGNKPKSFSEFLRTKII